MERTAWALGPLPESRWLVPPVLGFLAGAIEGLALSEGALGPDGLAALQLDAWARLTGGAPSLFATQLSVLSAQGDAALLRGREAGLAFAVALLAGDEETARLVWDEGVVAAA
jgi:hypothetical protein